MFERSGIVQSNAWYTRVPQQRKVNEKFLLTPRCDSILSDFIHIFQQKWNIWDTSWRVSVIQAHSETHDMLKWVAWLDCHHKKVIWLQRSDTPISWTRCNGWPIFSSRLRQGRRGTGPKYRDRTHQATLLCSLPSDISRGDPAHIWFKYEYCIIHSLVTRVYP